jgi:MoaA/NifB/PqqE/SkfB family radical SAM enzyme
MVRYLKARGAYVLFNTNGTVLTPERAASSQTRASTSCASRSTPPTPHLPAVRGKDYFSRIVRNVRAFTEMQEREGSNVRACRCG